MSATIPVLRVETKAVVDNPIPFNEQGGSTMYLMEPTSVTDPLAESISYRTVRRIKQEKAILLWVEERMFWRFLTDTLGNKVTDVLVSEGYYVRIRGCEWEAKVDVF